MKLIQEIVAYTGIVAYGEMSCLTLNAGIRQHYPHANPHQGVLCTIHPPWDALGCGISAKMERSG